MWGDAHILLPIVRGTARTSTLLFALGTLSLGIPYFRRWQRFAFSALCVSHAFHYSAVFLHIRAAKGAAFLTSSHFLAVAMFGTVMYSLMLVLATAPPDPIATLSTRRRLAETVAVYALGLAFTLAYFFRLTRTPIVAFPLLALEVTALAAFIRARHFRRPAASVASAG